MEFAAVLTGRVGLGRRVAPLAQLDLGDQPGGEEGEEGDRHRDQEDGLDRLGIAGHEAVPDRGGQQARGRMCLLSG